MYINPFRYFLIALLFMTSLTIADNTGINSRAKLGNSSFTQATKLTASDGIGGDEFGTAVSISGDVAVIGAPSPNNTKEAAYIFLRNSIANSWRQVARLTAPNAGNDDFGSSVSTSEDTVIVGSRLDDDDGTNSGTAYIFGRNQGGLNNWGQVTRLAANDITANAVFGTSVAIFGDTAVVGAPNVLAAYVFSRNAGGINTWGQATKAIPPDGGIGDDFGRSIALTNDTMVIGAPLDDDRNPNNGSAYVFIRDPFGNPNDWIQIAKLLADDRADNDQFGFSVSISGDTVLVGAPIGDGSMQDSGSAYIFNRNQGGANAWGQVTKITAELGMAGDQFGRSVAVSGDIAVVGALSGDGILLNSGTAYVFARNQGGANAWGQVDLISVGDGFSGAQFGISASLSGETFIIGARRDDDRGSSSGGAYIFQGSTPLTIPSNPDINLDSNQNNAQLGRSVAEAGDINGDSYPDMIVGLPLFDNGDIDEGVVRLFLGTPDGISNSFTQQIEINQSGAQFGFSVAGVSDLNNDGFDDVAVGAPLFDDGETNEGAIFIYLGSSNGLITPAIRTIQGNQADAQLGFSVAAAGNVNQDEFPDIIAGAPFHDGTIAKAQGPSSPQGAIGLLLGGLVNAISNNLDLLIPGSQSGSQFGSSVAGVGDVNGDGFDDVAAGAPAHSNGSQQNAGAASIFSGSNNGINTANPIAQIVGNTANQLLGTSLARLGDTNFDGLDDVAVGAPGFESGEPEEGAAFIYLGSQNVFNTTPAVTLQSNRPEANLGSSITSTSDLNSDGIRDIIAGAPRFSRGEPEEGAAYVFLSDTRMRFNQTPEAILESNQAGARQGASVANVGELDERGFTEFAIGSPFFDRGQTDEGSVAIYNIQRISTVSGTGGEILSDSFEN